MHKDEWSRIIIICISSAPEGGMFWEKAGSCPVSACSHPTELEGDLFIYSWCLSQAWLWRSGHRNLLLRDAGELSHKRGCAEAPLSLWIRVKDLPPPLSSDLSKHSAPAAVTPWHSRRDPSLGNSWTPASQESSSLKVFLMPDWAHCGLQRAGLCVPISTWEQHTWMWWLAQASGAACAGKHRAWQQVVVRMKGYDT